MQGHTIGAYGSRFASGGKLNSKVSVDGTKDFGWALIRPLNTCSSLRSKQLRNTADSVCLFHLVTLGNASA